jgi:exodeoxyribonuclease VII large subunit
VSDAHTWSVPEVNEWLTTTIAQAFPDDVWVEGEICNLSRSARGHVYFTLIEPGDDRRSASSSLSVTLFDWYRQKVNLALRRAGGAVRMEDGVRVRIRGHLELYAAKGQVQLRMIAIDPAFTLGDLAVQREKILAALAADGLLDANARIAVIDLPLRVGLVTSLGSAAHADFVHELDASGIGFELIAVDARVQGAEADLTIAAALSELHRRTVNVIALVRGGGARTDLAAFDSELIARAIAASPIPVWTGIGHEIDRTVADEVAHTAFKTPTACAGALVERVRFASTQAERAWARIASMAIERLDAERDEMRATARLVAVQARARCDDGAHRLTRDGHRLEHVASRCADQAQNRLELVARSIGPAARRHLERNQASLADRRRRLVAESPRRLEQAARTLDAMEARARAYDPARTLARGWSITRDAAGQVVRDVTGVSAGDELTTTLASGTVRSTVTEATDERELERRSEPGG